jgi:hypothetical protein
MATLDKFGVPLNGAKLGILHPKQSYRFRVLFNGFGDGSNIKELIQNVVSVTRPTYTQEEVALHSYNSIGYIGGKPQWETITLTVRDDINSSVANAIGAQIQKQFNHFEQTSATAGINYKYTMEIHALDGSNGDSLETWALEGCFLTNVTYGEQNYESSDAMTIEMTIRFDNATQLAGANNNSGNTVGDPFDNTPSPSGGSTFG